MEATEPAPATAVTAATATAVKLSFALDDGSKRNITIPLTVAMMIPKIKAFLESDEGKREMRYTFEFSTTVDAVKTLFQWKTCSVDKTKRWSSDELTPEQWKEAAVLAQQLGDESFIDYMIETLDLDKVDPSFLGGRIETYLHDCFFPDCECDAGYAKGRYDAAKAWFTGLPEDQQEAIKKIYRAYLDVRGVRLYRGYIDEREKAIIRNKLKEIGPDAEGRFFEKNYFWTWYYAIDERVGFDYSNTEVKGQEVALRWYNIPVETRWMIIEYLNVETYFEKLPKCVCKPTFSESWTYFCSEDPKLARFIWENMDREELLNNTEVAKRRVGTMKKSTFDELIKYVTFISSREPEAPTRDPEERRLKNILKAARKGTPVGNRGVRYINSQEVAEAEAKLAKYRSDKKRAAQSARSKEAIKEKQEQMYTGNNNNNNNAKK
jgi:hypothetical protein